MLQLIERHDNYESVLTYYLVSQHQTESENELQLAIRTASNSAEDRSSFGQMTELFSLCDNWHPTPENIECRDLSESSRAAAN